jgi:hypothetical protein
MSNLAGEWSRSGVIDLDAEGSYYGAVHGRRTRSESIWHKIPGEEVTSLPLHPVISEWLAQAQGSYHTASHANIGSSRSYLHSLVRSQSGCTSACFDYATTYTYAIHSVEPCRWLAQVLE